MMKRVLSAAAAVAFAASLGACGTTMEQRVASGALGGAAAGAVLGGSATSTAVGAAAGAAGGYAVDRCKRRGGCEE
jgi:osmotically inducible lipoprotein OsmB